MTTTLAADGPNAEQIEYWNSVQGAKWVAHQERLDPLIEPFGEFALERAGIATGERAIDVGCGCGATCLALARRVGPRGRVLGIDISAVMLERASERALAAGATQVEFANVDAQTHPFEPHSHDVVFSRFGVMFFADPTRAFTNLRSALRPGGGVAFVCWRPLAENPWMTVPVAAVAAVIAPPPPPPPGAPGPFSFGDPERVRQILGEAGFERIELAPHEREIVLGSTTDEAAEFALTTGPASRLLEGASAADRARAAQVVRDALAPHASGGRVALGSAIWCVTARNPD
jgi:SAM-dependent methyltransferase